jgi:hypothetical protein
MARRACSKLNRATERVQTAFSYACNTASLKIRVVPCVPVLVRRGGAGRSTDFIDAAPRTLP